MKVYRQVDEDAEYREYYDSYRVTVENLNDTDFLYKSMLTNGQVFFVEKEMFGFVNNQPALRGKSLTITRDYVDNFTIRDFKVFTRATNTLLDININCNLKDYRDNKPHYLYIVLSNKGKYEVYDDMFQSDETKLIFARFILDNQGNTKQFYMMLPFAGSADYIKGNQFYQVTDGLRVEVANSNTKQLTLTDAKIRFSGINFDDVASPDCLEVKFEGNAVPIRYTSVWDNTAKVPRVDWDSDTLDALTPNRIMNYTSGAISSVTANKFSIQKLYYDVYTKTIIAMYGDRAYNSMEEAVYAIDSVMNYKLPDGIEYLIPIAAMIIKNSNEAYSQDTLRIINLDYNEKEVLDSDTFTRQQAQEAITKARQALDTADSTSAALNEHVGDRTNPHRVKLNQLYNSEGQPVTIDDSYADWTVSSILSRAASSAADLYYLKTGGTISGNVSIGTSSAVKNLTVTGTSTLTGNVSLGGALSVKGNITTDNTYNIGTNASRFGTAYLTTLNASSNSSITGDLTARNLLPETTLSYNLGSSSKRYNNLYVKDISASGALSAGGNTSISGTLSVTGNTTLSGNLTMGASKKIEVNNGYIVVGGYSFRLGGSGTIPTQNGYGIW